MVINLFVAILLENFDESALKQKLSDYEEKQRGKDTESKILPFINKLKHLRDVIFGIKEETPSGLELKSENHNLD